jgi:isopenicillin N synthase-like dioxygenase
VLVTAIVIPEGDAKLRVEGNLGEMLAIAASGRIRSTLAAVANSGCGGGI